MWSCDDTGICSNVTWPQSQRLICSIPVNNNPFYCLHRPIFVKIPIRLPAFRLVDGDQLVDIIPLPFTWDARGFLQIPLFCPDLGTDLCELFSYHAMLTTALSSRFIRKNIADFSSFLLYLCNRFIFPFSTGFVFHSYVWSVNPASVRWKYCWFSRTFCKFVGFLSWR